MLENNLSKVTYVAETCVVLQFIQDSILILKVILGSYFFGMCGRFDGAFKVHWSHSLFKDVW